MEIVSADGLKTQIKPGQIRELGRAQGLNSSDKTISRRHVSFFVPPCRSNQELSIQFEVLGKNPIYVSKNSEVKIFRRFERGELENGDMFCIFAKNPVWYTLRKIENGGESVRQNDLESQLAGNLESGFGSKGVEDLQQEGVDLTDIEPVKEFGFLVIGHEFDSYPKKMIRDFKNFDWFLEEARKDREDDDDDEDDEEKKGKGSGRRKRKKGTENDDEEWTGDSEDDEMLINKSRNAQRPKYMTRSKDHGKPSKDTSKDRGKRSKDTSKSKSTTGKKNGDAYDENVENEDEDDETLGGFIVDDENLEEEEEIGDEDEEEEAEEELVDEYDEDE